MSCEGRREREEGEKERRRKREEGIKESLPEVERKKRRETRKKLFMDG